MKLSLYQRLSLSLSVVFVVIASIFYLWSEQVSEQSRYISQQRLHLSLAANLARDNPLLQQGVYDQHALENLFHTLMVLGPAFEFYFLDVDGNILTYSADDSLIKRNRVNIEPLLTLIKNQATLPVFGDDPRHISKQKIFSAAPVFNNGVLQGYLYVIVAGARYDNVFDANHLDKQSKSYLMLIISTISFLFILLLGLFWFVTNPVRRLQKDITIFIDSDFDKSKINFFRWQKNTNNEVYKLGSMFELIADKITGQLQSLAKTDQERRELLTHISHDLRTPLASMQGFLETISIANSSPNKAEIDTQTQQQYLQTVLRNCHQLNQLIDQLFELAHLESGQVSVNLESINLTEIAYDVVAKFSLLAKEKQISLIVDTSNNTISINTDIAKLERVLSNLVDNAIRHTNHGGKVEIEIKQDQQKKISISVIDNGNGIKKEEIGYIFDARYRASNSVNDDKTHNGLGLAITKRLLDLIDADIKVDSTLAKGSTFTVLI
ncbi:sensor histidine kinase [Thalassotalea crassostreae]|uniref:sensor histidine kinase n=1 Tax=Thalassotalea crassostreae TaxID=1763536 RepID=UPI000839438C|nr:HAMP domain-containing sensor histidine kinase [Thalassotalea crassostreae]